jgi:hypothetical protein
MLEFIVLGRIPGTGVFLSPAIIGIGFLLTVLIAGAYFYKKHYPGKDQQPSTNNVQTA